MRHRLLSRFAIGGDSLVCILSLLGISPLFSPSSTWAMTSGGGYVGLSFENYGTESTAADNSTTLLPQVKARLDAELQNPGFESKLDLEAMARIQTKNPTGSYSQSHYRYLRPAQAYISTGPALLPPMQVSFGRKKISWLEMDETWRLGIWQPRFRWDYLRPELDGLTGFFVESRELSEVTLSAAFHPIHIPDLEAPLDFDKGRCNSISPWGACPNDKITLFNQSTETRYYLAKPKLQDVLLNPGFSLRARLGASMGPWLQMGYAYKPMNQFLMAYQGGLMLKGGTPPEAQVNLFPRVVYHQLVSLEGGTRSERWEGSVSILSDQPINTRTESEQNNPLLNFQNAAHAISFSPRLEWALFGRARGELSYLKVWQGAQADTGPLQEGQGTLFFSRYPFQEAVRLGVHLPVKGLAEGQVYSRFEVTHDFASDTTLLSEEISYQASRHFSFQVALDLLGVGRRNDPLTSVGHNYVSRYRANDRILGGVRYVF